MKMTKSETAMRERVEKLSWDLGVPPDSHPRQWLGAVQGFRVAKLTRRFAGPEANEIIREAYHQTTRSLGALYSQSWDERGSKLHVVWENKLSYDGLTTSDRYPADWLCDIAYEITRTKIMLSR